MDSWKEFMERSLRWRYQRQDRVQMEIAISFIYSQLAEISQRIEALEKDVKAKAAA
jgi:hypothetical protein